MSDVGAVTGQQAAARSGRYSTVEDGVVMLTRRAIPVRAVQCRRDNKAAVDAFLAAVQPWTATERLRYWPNEYGGWQWIRGHRGTTTQSVWIDWWLVEIPESNSYRIVPDWQLDDLYEGAPDA